MKILLVNWQDRLNPQAGGAEIHLHETFGRLAERGHHVTILASGWKGAAARGGLDGMQVHRAGSRHTFGAVAPGHYRRHLAAEPWDVVVEALNKVPVFTPLWARRPTVLLVHHLFGLTAFREAPFPLAAATWLLERLLPAVYRGVPTQVISHSTADDLVARGLHRRDVAVIHPGVDVSYFAPDPAVPRAAEPTFLYLGRLRRYKGVHFLLRALAVLRERGVAARLQVGGKGDYEPALRALAAQLRVADRVDFLGYVSEERKRELFRTAWANLYPSPKEGWGITNLEAAACGTPSVASDSPGLRESVVDGRTGLLVPHGNVEALAGALERLARAPEEVARLGREARAFAERFTWNRTAAETERHLEGVVAGARRA